MKKSVLNNAIFNTLYQLINTLFPLISAVYASRILMPEGIGAVSYAQNIASYFVALAPLGVTSYGVRVIARSHGNRVEVNTRFWELFAINGISTVLFSLLYYGYVGCSGFDNPVLLWICGVQVILNGIDIDWFYQGMEEFGYITLRNFVVKILSLAALFLFVRDSGDLVPYLLISIGAILGNRLVNVIYARRYIGLEISCFQLRGHLLPELILLLNSFLGSIFNKIDITMLGHFQDNYSVGIYTNAFKLIGIIQCLCVSMTSAFLPRLSYYFAEDRKKYSELIQYGVQVVLFLAVPAVAGICLIAPRLIPLLFGGAFLQSVSVVRILSMLVLIKGLGNLVCYQVLISAGLERKQTLVYACAAVVSIGLNLLLIPVLGPNGAAIAAVLAELCLNLLILRISKQIVDIRLIGKNTGKTLFSVLPMTAAVWGVLALCRELSNMAAVLLSVLTGVLVYVGVNYFLQNDLVQDAVLWLRNLWNRREKPGCP